MRETRLKHINEGFTQSKKKYLENIAYWEKSIYNHIRQESSYKKWLENCDGNGKLLLNGNPAFSLIDRAETRALRIMQIEPRSKKPYLAAWVEDFEMNGKEIPVLAIGLELSTKTQMASLNLIELWFNNYESASFKKVLERYNSQYQKNYTPSAEEKAFELQEEINEEINYGKWRESTLNDILVEDFKRLSDLTKRLDENINRYNYSKLSSILKVYTALTAFNNWILSISPRIKKTSSASKAKFSAKYIGRKKDSAGIATFSILVSKHVEDITKHNDELLHELQEKE